MAKAGIGYAIMLDKLVHTGQGSDIVFRPIQDVPTFEMYIIWRKHQTFTSVAELLIKELFKTFKKEP